MLGYRLFVKDGKNLVVQLTVQRKVRGVPRNSHTEQGRALCVLERALPTELLRQLSWLGRITHTQSKAEHSVF